MKKFIFSLFTVIVLFAFGFKGSETVAVSWEERIDTAVKIAKSENKSILVNFTGSDWCIWCKKLDQEVFSQKEFKEYAESNLVLVKIDFPRSIKQTKETKEYNVQLKDKYEIEGFPTIILLDSEGNYVNTTGYQEGGAAKYVEHLTKILKKK